MINGIRKGKVYERKIVKRLSTKYNIVFKRVPMSGGFATGQNVDNPVFKGDIFTENVDWNREHNAVIECKCIKKLTLIDYVNYMKGTGIIFEWVKQCVEESKGMNFWLIFTYKNAKKNFIIVGKKDSAITDIMFLEDWLAL